MDSTHKDIYKFKRSAIHNIYVTSSVKNPSEGIKEGLVLPREYMNRADIVPYERLIVTRIGGDNWKNRMSTWAIPNESIKVEARGSISHLLSEGDLCCVITSTYLGYEELNSFPAIDIRFYPKSEATRNNPSKAKIALEYSKQQPKIVSYIDREFLKQREKFPRELLSNLVTGLKVSKIERCCIDYSAELPTAIMEKAGLLPNQTVFVYNRIRGGISAESYVVPNRRDDKVVISGALSKVADIDDIISEAAFVITKEKIEPTIVDI